MTKKTKSTKRPAAKATAAKKPTTKKTTTKKATSTKAKAKPKGSAASSKSKTLNTTSTKAKKPLTKVQPKTKSTNTNYSSKDVTLIKTTLKETKVPTFRRPATNPSMPMDNVSEISAMFNEIRSILESYAAHLRSLDRRRLNGVGIRKLGFIERAYEYALENINFLPQYLTIEKFTEDRDYYINLRLIFDMCTQLREIIWNLTLQAADVTYTDALDFYAAVREASKRRIDGAETIHRDLEKFFNRSKSFKEEPTEKMLKKDVNALLHGKRDGKVIIENIKPKTSGGVHKVIDETFKDTEQFKETKQGEIDI